MSKVVYLCYYSLRSTYRIVSPAAVTMIKYVSKVLTQAVGKITIISPAQVLDGKFYPQEETVDEQNNKVIFLPSYYAKPKNYFMRIFNRFCRLRDLRHILQEQLSDGDTLIVYHSLALIEAVKWILKRRKIRLVIQVCEIYADVLDDKKQKKREMRLFELADAFIFSSTQLEERINTKQKKYAICLGTYQVEPDRGIKFHDGKIHVVYAGTFDPRKGGAIAAAAAGEFLPENYHVHIIGFGSEKDKKYLLYKIEEVSKKSKCTVTYDGLKSGEEYIQFIQSCDIGLSTQNPNAAFNETSFPSKVLSYLANGLRVVSIRIKALEQSAVNDLLFYYDENSPQAIAEAVKRINPETVYDSRKRIADLSENFVREIEALTRD